MKNFEILLKVIKKGSMNDVKDFLESFQTNITHDILLQEHKSGDTVLHYCVRYGHLNIIKYLHDEWKLGFEHANKDGKKILHEAAYLCKFDIVNYLLNNSVEIDCLKHGDWTPLMMACTKMNNLLVVKPLIQKGSNYSLKNKDGWNCFHIACRSGDLSTVQYLFENCDNIWNTQSKNLRTPLHTAALHNKFEIIKYLVQNCDYSINSKDSCGNTPLIDALRCGGIHSSKFLIDNGGSLYECDNLGRTALHICAEMGVLESIKLLLDNYQMDSNILTTLPSGAKGQTPLHWAYKENQLEAINLLIKYNANEQIRDWKGRLPCDMQC